MEKGKIRFVSHIIYRINSKKYKNNEVVEALGRDEKYPLYDQNPKAIKRR